jgi:hypothetical protein
MMEQMFDGFHCELLRRDYTVELTRKKVANEIGGSMQGIGSVVTLEVSKPPDLRPTNIFFHHQYQPLWDTSDMRNLSTSTDVLVMNVGLHFSWKRRYPYHGMMRNLLNAMKDGNVTLFAHTETSAQNFDAEAGDYYKHPSRTNNLDCVPM